MSSWVKEFRDFINRGNVIDLAVAVVIGAAFGAVVTSFVNDILMQIIAAITGNPDFSALTIDVGDGEIRYGAFINAVISFLGIAFGVFLVVKAYNRFKRQQGEDPAGPSEVELLTEIRDALTSRRPPQ
jgi:large conductance mechanosensitive channel